MSSNTRTITGKPYWKLDLEDLFYAEEIDDKVALARIRVLQVFRDHCETHRGKMRPTQYYISDLGSEVRNLARRVCEESSKVVTEEEVRRLTGMREPRYLRSVAATINYQFVVLAIEQMKNSDNPSLWSDVAGTWYAKQSALDELWSSNRSHPRRKFDRRNEHGQVRSQRKARNRPSGASTSFARVPWVG